MAKRYMVAAIVILIALGMYVMGFASDLCAARHITHAELVIGQWVDIMLLAAVAAACMPGLIIAVWLDQSKGGKNND